MKFFFMCTHPNQGTGYARVANKLTNYLVENNDLTYFAFQNFPNQDIKDHIETNYNWENAYKTLDFVMKTYS